MNPSNELFHEPARPEVGAPFLPPARRVLAVRGGALGDFILTLPALAGLRRAGCEIELLTRPAYGTLAVGFGWVSGWRSLEGPEAGTLLVPGADVPEAWLAWLSGFNVVVSWLPDPDGTFQQQIRRCGAARFVQGDWRCGGRGSAAVQLAAPVQGLGAGTFRPCGLFENQEPGVMTRKNLMAFHPGSGSPRKNWPLERWLEVIRRISLTNPEIRWLVITGEAETERFQEIAADFNQSGLPWESAHGLELTALAHRLRECRGFLGHDSGISHLAAACGVPCGLLFGPTDPAVWAPPGEWVRVCRAPCGQWAELLPGAVLDWWHQAGGVASSMAAAARR